MPIPKSLALLQQALIAKRPKLDFSQSITRFLWRRKICAFSTSWHILNWNLLVYIYLIVAISSAQSSGSMKQKSSKSIFWTSIQRSGTWSIENRREGALTVAQTSMMRQVNSMYPNSALEIAQIRKMTINLANWWWLKKNIPPYHKACPTFWPLTWTLICKKRQFLHLAKYLSARVQTMIRLPLASTFG